MFRLLQKVLNLSETKLLPESEIIFFGCPYSAKIILHINIRLSADNNNNHNNEMYIAQHWLVLAKPFLVCFATLKVNDVR